MSDPVTPFDPHRFASAAPHYLGGRPAYAPALIRRVADLAGLGPRHRVLDLGCGPGQLAQGFAYFAGAVLAMDPEPQMLALAAARAEGVLPNVTFVEGSSYDLGPELAQAGLFRLVAVGRAFHWMDRAETLRRLDALVEPEGAVALFADTHPEVPENAWAAEFRAVRARYAGKETTPRDRPGWIGHEAMLLDSPFRRVERIGLIERRRVSTGSLVDRALSMSGSSRAKLGEAADRLAAEIVALADRVAVEGWLSEVVESTALVAFRAR